MRQVRAGAGKRRRGGEQGAALIVAITLLLMAGLSLVLDAMSIYGKRVREDKSAVNNLNTIKKSLIAYAARHGAGGGPGGPSVLPCAFAGAVENYENPANTVDAASSGCTNAGNATVGLLPWQPLKLPPLRDGSGAPIWYAVSDSCGLQIDAVGNYAVVLFAPGKSVLTDANNPASFQSRNPATSPASQAAYLDGGNAAASTAFTLSQVSSKTFNDRGLGILCTEIPSP
ncbi:MAG: hypothetical protein H7835_04990 [Magnetococcus sp. XQGC-1]